MTDVTSKLQVRKDSLTKEATQLHSEKTQLVEQGKVINKRVSDIVARELQINGAYKEILDLMGEEPVVAKPEKEAKPVKK